VDKKKGWQEYKTNASLEKKFDTDKKETIVFNPIKKCEVCI